MGWMREAINDGSTGRASAKRVAMLSAAFSLSGSALLLAFAAIVGKDVAAALGAVAVPLAGLAGGAYVGGKHVEAGRSGATPE